MTERNFPSAFDELPAFLIYEPKADGDFALWGSEHGEWKKGKHWADRPKHTVAELREFLDARPSWHLAFFPEGTPFAVLDFDFKKFDATVANLSNDELVRLGEKINANRTMMDDWLSELQQYTYVAVSKSRNGHHAVIEYPCNRRRIETSEGHPLDLLGAGFGPSSWVAMMAMIIFTSSAKPRGAHTLRTCGRTSIGKSCVGVSTSEMR